MIGQNVGKYRILDKIGKGGMGTVYKAVDDMLHREVAIKVLNAELNDPEVARRFRTEAITVARLNHPGIATIYELFEHEGEWLMVMEFVRGETLEHMVARMGALSAQRAAEFCMQALGALAHAHSMGVVHRDLKPANLMVTENGTVKVMDFGIARVTGGEHLTNAGFMMGTPSYMAPEQVRGGEIDARADLYSMGVVFYRLATGRLPFKGDTAFAIVQSQVNDPPTPVATIRPDLPPWVEEVIARSLAKAPEHRFQSAAEFHEAFARCLAGLPLSSMYAVGAGELGMTPPRPMPTGSFVRPMPTPGPTPYPAPYMTGSHPTMLSPGTNPGALASSTDPTVLTPAMGHATGAIPATAPQPVMTTPAGGLATQVPVASGSAAAQASPAPKSSKTLLMVGAAVVVVAAVGIGGYMATRDSSQPPPSLTAETQSSGGGAEPAAVQAPAVGQTASGESIPTPPPAAPAAPIPPPVGAAGSSAKPTPAATPGAGGNPARGGAAVPPTATPATTPAPAAGARGANPADTVLATFNNIKMYVLTGQGRRTADRDVIVNFLGGQVLVMPRAGGEPIAAVPYRRILRATYSLGRDPKWDETLMGPPPGLDVGSFMRQTRHWFVVQGAEAFAVLRLEDNNFRQILETFEHRTGIAVDRRK